MPRNALWRVVRHSTRWGAGALAAVTMIAAASCTNGGATDPTAPVTTGASAGPTSSGTVLSTSGTVPSSNTTVPPSSTPRGIPAGDVAAIRATINAINATAGGSVAAQRKELDKLAAPSQLARQRACPTAHSTLAFQPAYRDLRRAYTADADRAGSASETTSRSGTGLATASRAHQDGSSSETHGPPGAGHAASGAVAAPGSAAGTSTPATSEAGHASAYLLPAFITIYTGDRITGTDLTTLHLWVIGGTARTGALCVS